MVNASNSSHRICGLHPTILLESVPFSFLFYPACCRIKAYATLSIAVMRGRESILRFASMHTHTHTHTRHPWKFFSHASGRSHSHVCISHSLPCPPFLQTIFLEVFWGGIHMQVHHFPLGPSCFSQLQGSRASALFPSNTVPFPHLPSAAFFTKRIKPRRSFPPRSIHVSRVCVTDFARHTGFVARGANRSMRGDCTLYFSPPPIVVRGI